MGEVMTGPLAGVKVVEVGTTIAVSFCGKLLADLGATVIKIEHPEGDPIRWYGPFPDDIPDLERSGLFLYLNTSKMGVTLNRETAIGRSLLSRAVEECDILIHDIGLGSEGKWRPDYALFSRKNPNLISTSMTVFGSAGPHSGYKGNGLQAAAGSVAYHMGDPGREPLGSPVREADYWGGLQGCAATLVALYARRNIGRGQEVDISSMESLSTLVNAHRDLRAVKYGKAVTVGFGGDTPRQGYHGWILPWVTLPCKDGYVVVMSSSVCHWQWYLDLMEDQEWARDPRIRDLNREYIENELGFDMLDTYQINWLEKHTKKQLFDMFGRIRVPFQPVHKIDEVVNSDHMAHREFLVNISHPEAGEVRMPGLPFKLPASPWVSSPSPRLGEHNDKFYCELLNLTPEDLSSLYKTGVA